MLELKHLSFEVNDDKGEKGIIKDISLKVNDGKFVVITGPNGGGNPPRKADHGDRTPDRRSDFL